MYKSVKVGIFLHLDDQENSNTFKVKYLANKTDVWCHESLTTARNVDVKYL